MNKSDKIVVFGHKGLVGSSIMRKLNREGYTNLITISSKDLDLRNQQAVNLFFSVFKPTHVFIASGRVGGIMANNTRRGEFIYDNIMIQTNVIHAAYVHNVKKLLALGSACIYNRENDGTPIRENQLLTGSLEPTNEPYAISKIAAIKTCEAYRDQYGCNFISLMPTNMYGIGDNYNLQECHVLPALLRKIHEAKKNNIECKMWGDGLSIREFLYSEDGAEAMLHFMNNYNGRGHINIGTGVGTSISELAAIIAEVVGFTNGFVYDTKMSSGMPRRILDVSLANSLGWKAKTALIDGIRTTYSELKRTHELFR